MPGGSSFRPESKMRLLVEAPAAVDDALASLLDHNDLLLQVQHARLNHAFPTEHLQP